MNDSFDSPFGRFELQRRPPAPGQPLQAWDAADEYLLEQLQALVPQPASTLVINDQFGALAVALHPGKPHSWGDSYSAQLATQENIARTHTRPLFLGLLSS